MPQPPVTLAVVRPVAEDLLVAATIATEVPPRPSAAFPLSMIELATRAVAEVILNRVARPRLFAATAVEVILAPKQFSAVLRGLSVHAVGHGDVWPRAVAGTWYPDHVARCYYAWRRARDARLPEAGSVPLLPPTTCWYYSPISMRPPGASPRWAADLYPVTVPGLAQEYFRFFSDVSP